MQLWTEIVEPAELTAFARVSLSALDTNPLSAALPNLIQEKIVFSWIAGEIYDDVAEYSSFDAESTIGGGGEVDEKFVRLLPVSRKRLLSEEEQIVDPPRVSQLAEDKTEAAIRAVLNRLNLARAEALVTGGLELNENDVVQTVDFGRDPAQTNAAPGALWNASGADPIADLQGWVEATGADIMYAPSRIAAVLAAALVDANYITGSGPIVPRALVNETLEAFGLPRITVMDTLVAGQRLIPANSLVLASSGGRSGRTVLGPTVEASDPRFSLNPAQRPGVVAGLYREDDPPVGWAMAKATGLPVLTNPDATLSAVVLPEA